jgi:hypothetical protein
MPKNEDFALDEFGAAFGAQNWTSDEYRYMEQFERDRARNNVRTHIAINDPRAQSLSDYVTMTMTGNTRRRAEAQSERVEALSGAMINSRFMNQHLGGSRVDMFSGIAAGVGNAGLLNQIRYGSSRGLQGHGAMTDMVSHSLLNSMESHFYTPGGMAVQSRTHGFDRGDMGRIVAQLGMNGAINPSGSFTAIRTQDEARSMLAQLETERKTTGIDANPLLRRTAQDIIDSGEDRESPRLMFRNNAQSIKNLNDTTESAADAMRAMKTIMGPNAGIQQLMTEIDNLMGGGMVTAEQFREGKRRVQELNTLANSVGANSQVLFGRQQGFSDSLTQMGMSRHAAAAAGMDLTKRSAYIMQDQNTYRKQMAEQSVWVPEYDQNVLDQVLLMDQAAVGQEMPEVTAMLYAVQQHAGLAPEEKQRLVSQITNASKMGTREQRLAALGAAEKSVASATGMTARDVLKMNPNPQLNPEMAGVMSNVSRNIIDRRIMDQVGRNVRGNNSLETFGVSEDVSVGIAKTLFQNLGASSMPGLLEAAGAGNIGAFLKDTTLLSDDERSRVMESLRSSGLSGKQLQQYLQTMQGGIQSDVSLKAYTPTEVRRRAAGDMLKSTMMAATYGTGAVGGATFLEGLLGGPTIDPTRVAQFAESDSQGKSLTAIGSYGADGQFKMNEEQAAALMAKMGLQGNFKDAADMVSRTKTADGANGLLSLVQRKGGKIVKDSEGNVKIMTAKEYTEYSNNLADNYKSEMYKAFNADGAEGDPSAAELKIMEQLRGKTLMGALASGDEEALKKFHLVRGTGTAGMKRSLRTALSETIASKEAKLAKKKDGDSTLSAEIEALRARYDEMREGGEGKMHLMEMAEEMLTNLKIIAGKGD